MAMVILNWSAGLTPRQRPANDEPIAGVYLEVSSLANEGLRSRHGSAEPSSSDTRRRRKKRNSRRWNSRMVERDNAMRAFGWRCRVVFDLVLQLIGSVYFTTRPDSKRLTMSRLFYSQSGVTQAPISSAQCTCPQTGATPPSKPQHCNRPLRSHSL